METYPEMSDDYSDYKMGDGYQKSDIPLIQFDCGTEAKLDFVIEYIKRMESFYDGLLGSIGIRQLTDAIKFSTKYGHHKLGDLINKRREKCNFEVIEGTKHVEFPLIENRPSSRSYYTLEEAKKVCHVLTARHWRDLQMAGNGLPYQYENIGLSVVPHQCLQKFMENGVDVFFDIYLRGVVVSNFLAPNGKLTMDYYCEVMRAIWFQRRFLAELFSKATVYLPSAGYKGHIVLQRHTKNSKKKQWNSK